MSNKTIAMFAPIYDYTTGVPLKLSRLEPVQVVSFVVRTQGTLSVTAIPGDLGMQCSYTCTAEELHIAMRKEWAVCCNRRVFYLFDTAQDEFRAISL